MPETFVGKPEIQANFGLGARTMKQMPNAEVAASAAGQRRTGTAELTMSFLGAAGTVTGSRYLIEDGEQRLLVDCGLFQGLKELRLRNWAPVPEAMAATQTILLTHAHLDHSGYLPLLVRDGWRGEVICTAATADLCGLLLPDSGFLQEKDAEFANRHGFSKHRPALPLYTARDAHDALERFRSIPFETDQEIMQGVRARFRRAGHILGAAFIELDWRGKKILFSGDLGRFDDPVMLDPVRPGDADVLVVESTYGDRSHDTADPQAALGDAIDRCVRRGGTVVIPSFAVGRAQSLLFHLSRLKSAGRLRNIPIYLDSPMAEDASRILCRQPGDHRLSQAQCNTACGVAHYVRDVAESKALTASNMPKVIISASGMATGGRVLHHLKRFAPDAANLILFAGFQAAGTRGAAMLAGAREIKIHGNYFPVNAEVRNLSMFSAHADADEIMRWLRGFGRPPGMTFITHGEPSASEALRERIVCELGWRCHIPRHGEKLRLQ